MNYIQDKLDDTFRQIGQISGIHPEIVDEFILLKNQALTDYHNHIMKYLKVNHIDHCIQQNGLPYCKNCGLDLTEMEHDLSLLQHTNPKE